MTSPKTTLPSGDVIDKGIEVAGGLVPRRGVVVALMPGEIAGVELISGADAGGGGIFPHSTQPTRQAAPSRTVITITIIAAFIINRPGAVDF
jgi:hypothetical protein